VGSAGMTERCLSDFSPCCLLIVRSFTSMIISTGIKAHRYDGVEFGSNIGQ
jgi:cytochrome c biogenesis protein CcdA